MTQPSEASTSCISADGFALTNGGSVEAARLALYSALALMHTLQLNGHACRTVICPSEAGGFLQMSLKRARHATERMEHETSRAGQPSS